MYAVISMHTPDYQPLADYTWTKNKLEYAERHGYAAYCKTDDFRLPKNQVGGEKLRLFREYFDANPDVEWIWWLETDTLLTNFNTKIEDLIDNDYHFIIGTDGNGLNAGSFFLRNSLEGNAYLDWLILVWPKYQNHHFYEQQAMIDSTSMPEWSPIIKVEPQYKFNAHDCWPNQWQPGFGVDKLGKRAWWEPGDAVVHWPGSSLQTRLGRQIPYYMPKVIK
jgi:hypothetical protein